MYQINEASGSSKTTALKQIGVAIAATPVVKQLLSKRELAAVLDALTDLISRDDLARYRQLLQKVQSQ